MIQKHLPHVTHGGEDRWGLITHMLTPTITNKHKEVLHSIYRFRFLNRPQIQTLTKTQDKRNTNKLLTYLTTNGYLNRIHSTEIDKRKIPANYYIGKQGIRFLKTQDYIEKAYLTNLSREKHKKDQFISRCLFIADIYLKLQDNPDSSFVLADFIASRDFPADTITKHLRPDFGFVKQLKTKKEYTICKLLQDGMPRYAVRVILQKYLNYFKNKADTKLLFICQTDKLYHYTQYFIDKYLEELNDEEEIKLPVYIAKESELKENGIVKTVLKKVG